MDAKLELGTKIDSLGKLPEDGKTNIFTVPDGAQLDVVIKEVPEDKNTKDQATRIIKEFNAEISEDKSCFVTSQVRGRQIDPGKFVLGIRNNTAELHEPSGDPIARKLIITPGHFTRIVGTYDQSTRFYGACGRFVLNVPAGQYALLMSGNKPLIYGSGCHVIHDSNLKPDTNIKFVSQSDPYIQHSTIHLLRVPLGKLVKIKIGSNFYIVPGRNEPYVFNDPLMAVIPQTDNNYLIDQSEMYIQNGPKHMLRVPVGMYAYIKIGTQFHILEGRNEPYTFDDPLVEVIRPVAGSYFISQTEPYIHNGTKHILRVPEGKIAKIWIGSQPILLDARKEPYIIDNPLFRLETNKDQLFFDATDRLIKHGNIKRVIPRTGEVAITYNNGQLAILKPDSEKPYLITSSTHDVKEFISVGIETMVFPSEETKKQRRAENPKATPEEISSECFTTRDSLKVGVKLLVAFRITKPELAFEKLIDMAGILKHIENVATVDMGKAIQKCSSQEFLNFYQTKPVKESKDLMTEREEPKPVMHYQDEVKAALQKDLEDYGIELVRLNVETPKILDQQIATEMAQSSVQSAQANAKESTMDQRFRIARREAEQAAEVKRITIAQENEAMQLTAQAQMDSAKTKADAQIIQAQADKQVAELKADAEKVSILRRAEAEAQAIKMKAEAEKVELEIRGAAFRESPGLLTAALAGKAAEALGHANLTVTTAELATLLGRNTLTLFGNPAPVARVIDQHSDFQPDVSRK